MGLLHHAQREATQRAMSRGHPGWYALAGAAWGLRRARKAWIRREHVVFRERIGPGEQLVIAERQIESKRARRKR